MKPNKHDRMEHVQIIRACNKVGRSPQVVECIYCDLLTKSLVTRYSGPNEQQYRTIPAWNEFQP